jgi:excinuclease UvrABC nuclease subunit
MYKEKLHMIGPGLPGYNWTRTNILAYAPTDSGVYAIYNGQDWIYFGEGQDIKARLLAHFNGDNRCILSWQPTGFQFESVDANWRVARQDALILALHPKCNQRLG